MINLYWEIIDLVFVFGFIKIFNEYFNFWLIGEFKVVVCFGIGKCFV